jgi:phosphoglycolate phosphatase-like HAD superfamily hydrolase
MAFYVFDLDGTLADCQHRVPLIDGSNEGYRAFFSAVKDDAPIPHVIDVMLSLIGAGHHVEIWSGRSDECEAETQAWLQRHGIDPSHLTFMRQAGDKRPDDVVKRQMLRRAAMLGRRPDVIFDDRSRVVEMWRAEGVPCFQVAPGDF